MKFIDVARIRLINYFSFLCSVMIWALNVLFFNTGNILDFFVRAGITFFLLSLIFLNHKKQFKTAQLLFNLLVPVLCCGLIALYGYTTNGMEMYFMLFVTMGFIFYEDRRKQLIIILWNVFCFSLGCLSNYYYGKVFIFETNKVAEYIMSVFGIALVTTICYQVINSNFRFSQRMDKEKKRSDDLLLNILPTETANELKKNGKTKAKLINQATVLFVDFIDFEKVYKDFAPSVVLDTLNEIFVAFDKISTACGIEKIKTIGKVYMAAGGLPIPNKTNAHDVVNAAIQMVQFVEEYNENVLKGKNIQLSFKIGINTGTLVSGIVGLKKFQYDIWGDTVNIASRIQNIGDDGKITISKSTYDLIKNDFKCISRNKMMVKGKGEIESFTVEVQDLLTTTYMQ